jgi:predicted Rossmann fold nucleotide-binding protein DprA/Smf involved in DNA uptake
MVNIGGYKGLSYAILLQAFTELQSHETVADAEKYLDEFNETLWGEVLPVPRDFIERTKILVDKKHIKTIETLKIVLWELMMVTIIKNEPCSVGDIANNLGIQTASICKTLKKLQNKGVIVRSKRARPATYRVGNGWKEYFGLNGVRNINL